MQGKPLTLLFLLFPRYPFWGVRESLKDFYRYYFFQTLSVRPPRGLRRLAGRCAKGGWGGGAALLPSPASLFASPRRLVSRNQLASRARARIASLYCPVPT
jgi:hypothetical protein